MSQDPWEDVGITKESYFLSLMFEPLSRTLVAHFYRELSEGFGVNSLYARDITEDKYRRITKRTDGLSFEDPTLSPAGPHIFVNVMATGQQTGEYVGFDWNSLRKIDITNNEVLSMIEERDLEFEKPYDDGWISQIYGAGTSGDSVYCSMGLKRNTGIQSSEVDYYLAELSTLDGKYEIITKLNVGHL